MKGYLIVNSFISSQKFSDIYAALTHAARSEGIRLEIKSSADMLCEVGSGFSGIALPDFVLFWDKDIYLAKMLEACGIRLFNSARTVELCDDKALTAIALDAAGIPSPKTIIAPKTFEGVGYNDLSFLDTAADTLGFPLVIKEVCGSFGQQVYLAHNIEEARSIVSKIANKGFIMQKFISESEGRDIRVNVVGDKVVASMMRYNEQDFRSNVTNGGKTKQIDISPEEERVALDACRAVGADFAGIDLLFGKDGPLVCEINSNPHFKSTLECTGVDMSIYVLSHIMESLK